MIGNDIVDLKQAAKDSNWKRRGFLDKVFTTEEQQLIFSAKDKDQMVWLLWTMKEAAYKAHLQKTEIPFFNPKKIRCQLVSETEGFVSVFKAKYQTKSILTEDWIHTQTVSEENTFGFSDCFLVDALSNISQSEVVRQKLVAYYSATYEIVQSDIKIVKNSFGIPILKIRNQTLKKSLSLSHHGRFGAFAIC